MAVNNQTNTNQRQNTLEGVLSKITASILGKGKDQSKALETNDIRYYTLGDSDPLKGIIEMLKYDNRHKGVNDDKKTLEGIIKEILQAYGIRDDREESTNYPYNINNIKIIDSAGNLFKKAIQYLENLHEKKSY